MKVIDMIILIDFVVETKCCHQIVRSIEKFRKLCPPDTELSDKVVLKIPTVITTNNSIMSSLETVTQ